MDSGHLPVSPFKEIMVAEMQRQGLSAYELAIRAGVDPNVLARMINTPRVYYDFNTCDKLAIALGIGPECWWDDNEELARQYVCILLDPESRATVRRTRLLEAQKKRWHEDTEYRESRNRIKRERRRVANGS